MTPVQLQNLLQQGVAHHRAGRLADALACYVKVRSLAPRTFDGWHLSGVVALQQGRLTEAIAWLEKAVQINPSSAPAQMRLGLALISSGRPAEAEPRMRAAVAAQPEFVEGWDNLAYCLKTLDRLHEAIQCHERSVALDPRRANSWYNFGLTLSLRGRPFDALACHQRAIAADPNYANGYFGRAQALQQSHQLEAAIDSYGEHLRRDPQNHDARSYRLFALNYVDKCSREDLFAEHLAFARAVGDWPMPEFANEPNPERRLRVAILSPDLRNHSCAYFLEPLLEHLPAEQFELYLYHDHPAMDHVTARLKSYAAVWRNFIGQPGALVEKIIRADAPDLLIDLAGHTGMTSRLPLFARHLAPVQISYLGYPNTTGLKAMHYRFTDAIADPVGEADEFATERLVRFAPTAWLYQPPPDAPEVRPAPSTLAPAAPITFGCFNNLIKITDAQLAEWARLLEAVPGSRLMLKGRGLGDHAVQERYLLRFARAGLPAERVELVERTAGNAEHLALYGRVDIALDTFPYHGTTTTLEALWMGVPVVTKRGDRHASRVGASLLTALGRPQWIAENTEDYVRIATALAQDRAALAELRGSLRGELQRSALMDAAGQTERFALALRQCWNAWCESRVAVAP